MIRFLTDVNFDDLIFTNTKEENCIGSLGKIENFNPVHDKKGQFGSGSVSTDGGKSDKALSTEAKSKVRVAGEAYLAKEAMKYDSEFEFRDEVGHSSMVGLYWHATTEANASIIEKDGFTLALGDRSKGMTKGKGVWLFDKYDDADSFSQAKNFGDTGVVTSAHVFGPILEYDKIGNLPDVVGDRTKLVKEAKADGYVGISGVEVFIYPSSVKKKDVNFIFNKDALYSIGQMQDIYEKAHAKNSFGYAKSDSFSVQLNFNPTHDKKGQFGSGSKTAITRLTTEDSIREHIGKVREISSEIQTEKEKEYLKSIKAEAEAVLADGSLSDRNRLKVLIGDAEGKTKAFKEANIAKLDAEKRQGEITSMFSKLGISPERQAQVEKDYEAAGWSPLKSLVVERDAASIAFAESSIKRAISRSASYDKLESVGLLHRDKSAKDEVKLKYAAGEIISRAGPLKSAGGRGIFFYLGKDDGSNGYEQTWAERLGVTVKAKNYGLKPGLNILMAHDRNDVAFAFNPESAKKAGNRKESQYAFEQVVAKELKVKGYDGVYYDGYASSTDQSGELTLLSKKSVDETVSNNSLDKDLNFNPNHDKIGQFGSGTSSLQPIQFEDYIAEKYSKQGNNLSEDQKAAINDYVGAGSSNLNRHLVHPDDELVNHADEAAFARVLDSAMQNKLVNNVTLYRGFGMSQHLVVGTTVLYNGFSSTTFSPGTAEQFAAHGVGFSKTKKAVVLKIKAKKDQPGIFPIQVASDGANATMRANEQEFILPRGTRYKITKVDEVTNKYGIGVHTEATVEIL